MRRHRWGHGDTSFLTRLAVAIAILVIAPLASVPTASAAGSTPYCTGGSCNGKNPNGTNCASSGHVHLDWEFTTFITDVGNRWATTRVELRHSTYCKARWVRMTLISSTYAERAWLEYCPRGPYRCGREDADQFTSSGLNGWSDGTVWWSPMRTASDSTRICGSDRVSNPKNGVQSVTRCGPWTG